MPADSTKESNFKKAFEYVKLYLEKGLSVFPLEPGSKRPYAKLLADRGYEGSWKPLQEVRPSLEDLEYWFSKPANVAIVCGRVSGNLIVIDFDGPGRFEEWYGGLANYLKDRVRWTWRTRTGRGVHVYFRLKEASLVPRTKPHLKEGIDVKGEGGYVVAPPSVHPSGREYEFLDCDPRVDEIQVLTRSEWEELRATLGWKEAGKVSRAALRGRELSEEQLRRLVEIFKPYYVPGHRDLILYPLLGLLVKEGVSYDSARQLVEMLVEETRDEEATHRFYLVDYHYGMRVEALGKERLKGVSGLKEEMEKVLRKKGLSEEEATRRVNGDLAELYAILKVGGGLSVSLRHVTERERLAYEIYEEVMNGRVIKTFKVRSPASEAIVGIYWYEDGVYVPCEETLKAEVERLARERGVAVKVTRYVVNEVIARISRSTQEVLRREPLTIAFKDCLFDWEEFLATGSLRASVRDFSPDVIAYHRIPHRLNLSLLEGLEGLEKYYEGLADLRELASKLCPRALKAFEDWVGDKWVLLFEIAGYCLYPKYDLHKAVMLVGSGSNGKSTYLKFLKDLLGRENVASVSLQDLADEGKRFAVAQLHHKLANIYADLPAKALKSTGRFKVLTGEDPVTADRKFKEPITFVNYAKLIFSANELPKVRDVTEAFWRRWLVVEFPNKFPLNPRFYEETFTEEEVEGAIIVSLLAFRRVWLRRKFSFEGTGADYREYWLRSTDSVYAFIKALMEDGVGGYKGVKDPNGGVEAPTLYGLYVKFCEDEDMEAVDKRGFTIELERMGFPKVRRARGSYYRGLRLVEAP